MDFKEIDPKRANWNRASWAQKSGEVQAEFVPEGTEVTTVMANGTVETKNTAGIGGAMKVTAPTGEQWLVEKEKFDKRYEASETPGVFRPKFDPVRVLRLDEDVKFKAPWGEEMNIRAGGVLVKAGENDIYGIQGEEFEKSYRIASAPGAQKPTRAEVLDVFERINSGKFSGYVAEIVQVTPEAKQKAPGFP